MKEATGDLWTFPADWRVITTNGFVKKNGECVMGRGCASEAKAKYRGLASELGITIQEHGNDVHVFNEHRLITFPVKHNWWEKADLNLIRKSVKQFNHLIYGSFDETPIVMPRPGCGNGQLKWEDVKPILESLPDNVTVITFDG